MRFAQMGTRKNAWFFFSALFLCFSANTRFSIGASTLSVGESISGDETIISEGDGNFELGFFSPGKKSQNYYIGMWYRKLSEKTVVWVANREKPVSDKYSSKLKLSDDGNLVILDSAKTTIWSTNLNSIPSNAAQVALLDSGNLVLRNVSNSSDFMWESFDHPTDAWLPGGKLGRNKLTKKSQTLTSWKNSDDPAPGLFSLMLDPEIIQFVIMWNGSIKYWSSGPWNGHIFSLVPELRNIAWYNLSFIYVSNEKEDYFTYNFYNSSLISRLVINVRGQINELGWVDGVGWNLFWAKPVQKCDVYALCGPFATCNQQTSTYCGCFQGFKPQNATEYSNMSDWSGGCVRNTPLCVNNASVNGEKVGFLKMSNMRLPINPQSLAVGSAQACELACLNSCSCNAYAYDAGCSLWEGDLLNTEQLSDGDTSGEDLYLKLAASELSNSTSGGGKKKGSATRAIVSIVSGVIALLCLLVVLMWAKQYWRNFVGPSKAVEGSLVPFSFRDLQIVTKNFSEKLGSGGFGSVFKGTLLDTTLVAVKKLEGLGQGEKQFRTEVSTIGMVQHVNLVRLRGFCSEGTKRLLVYDFMPKGSLDSHLFHEKKDSDQILDWKTRYQIALGTARGLAYLHEKCRDSIIHCDIKPENILLDADFCPKVADFGMAKLVGREFSRVLTSMRGTIGYLAPEWISGLAITTKVDVYSYGMLLFELISGKRNSQSDGEKVAFFPIWAASIINENGEILSLLDYRLEGNADLEELNRACKVASWCIQDCEVHRPSMGLVVQILEGMVEVGTPPMPRTLQVLAENHENNMVFFEPS